MISTANGFPVITDGSSHLLHTWLIPTREGTLNLRLRRGSVGFLIAHYALWFADTIEPLIGRVTDDWGWAPLRPIRGYRDRYSEHCGGRAADLNATRHPLGRRGTFTALQSARIRARLLIYRGCLRWGGDYRRRADEMHIENVATIPASERIARALLNSPRGRRLIAVNPSQKDVILS